MSVSVLAELDAQYRQLREECAVVRRPSLRTIKAEGPEAGEYLQSQLTNDLDPLAPGEGIYAALLDRKARVQADMRVLRLDDETYLLLMEEEGFDAALRHLGMYKIGRQVEIDADDERAVVSLIGPAIEQRTGVRPGPPLSHRQANLGGVAGRAVSILLGEIPGIDFLITADQVPALIEGLERQGIPEVTEQALEILRIEAGQPRFGAEITPDFMPAEAGIVDVAVSFEKGCYIGQEPVARMHYKGRPNRILRRLKLSRSVEPGTTLHLDERELGTLSSVCVSPDRGALGLAVLRKEAEPGATITVGAGEAEAVVEDLGVTK